MSGKNVAIAVVQMDCTVGVAEPNLNRIRHFTTMAAQLGAALVIFPECATTGYFIGEKVAALADPPDGPISRELAEIARRSSVHLVCGLYTRENGATRNSQKIFAPDGACLGTYHKAHLFASERQFYQAGDAPLVVKTGIGTLGMTICYDLVFPGYVRKLVAMGADIIINSTDWINDLYQRDVWGWGPERVAGLASTRALENVVVLAMACRTGREHATTDLAFDSFGPSCVVSASGKFLARVVEGEGLAVATVDLADRELDRWRAIATYREDRREDLYA
jgi:5-aminopentanamidase